MIEAKHPAIGEAFGTGAGLRLMRRDSDITESITLQLLLKGAVADPLPIWLSEISCLCRSPSLALAYCSRPCRPGTRRWRGYTAGRDLIRRRVLLRGWRRGGGFALVTRGHLILRDRKPEADDQYGRDHQEFRHHDLIGTFRPVDLTEKPRHRGGTTRRREAGSAHLHGFRPCGVGHDLPSPSCVLAFLSPQAAALVSSNRASRPNEAVRRIPTKTGLPRAAISIGIVVCGARSRRGNI